MRQWRLTISECVFVFSAHNIIIIINNSHALSREYRFFYDSTRMRPSKWRKTRNKKIHWTNNNGRQERSIISWTRVTCVQAFVEHLLSSHTVACLIIGLHSIILQMGATRKWLVAKKKWNEIERKKYAKLMNTFHRKLMQTRHRRPLTQKWWMLVEHVPPRMLIILYTVFIDSLLCMMTNWCKHFSWILLNDYRRRTWHGELIYARFPTDKVAAERICVNVRRTGNQI